MGRRASGGSLMLGAGLLTGGLLALGQTAGPDAPTVAPEASLPVLDPNHVDFPATDLADFSPTLDAPAGRHGFLFVGTDGRFYFQDGTRARFWGINVAKDSVFVPKDVIDRAADAIARAGFNLVRLHHVDGVEGLLPPERAGTDDPLDPAKLDAVFYWVHALKQRGIHVYLDLLDFRTFQEAEGVVEAQALGRGAKPAAVFNERLIELQIAYARALLFDHVNPYTNLPLGRDPAVVMVELCDENGLFARLGKWDEMPPPYYAELQRRWNFWLRAAYGNTESLWQAWQQPDGRSALGADERLEDSSVRLRAAGLDADFPSPTGAPRVGAMTPTRKRDLLRFCYSVHREYFAEMKRALREAGLQAPVTAITDWEQPADLRAVADELDFTGCNWYYDHPVFAAGRQWHVPSFYSNLNPVADEAGLDFTSSALRAAVSGKPLVVREWGACWPSKFRGVGLLEAAAYAALQVIDAMIMFTYNTQPAVRRIEYFDVSSDPVRWGLAGIAGQLCRAQALDTARSRIGVRLTDDDCFGPQSSVPRELLRLGWMSQLRQFISNAAAAPEGYDRIIDPNEAPGDTSDLGAYTSDTGQIRRLVDEERLILDAPRVQAVAGALTSKPMRTSTAAFTSASPIGVIVALSLTDKPLADTDALLLKMVTVAANTGEQKSTRADSPPLRLDAFGDAPVLTHGKPAAQPTTIDLGGAPLISVYLENGTWEAVRKGGAWYVWCDTPGAKFDVPPLGAQVQLTPFGAAGAKPSEQTEQPFAYPKDCLFVRVQSAGP